MKALMTSAEIIAPLIARSPVADKTMRDWMKAADEVTREMGYSILCARLRDDAATRIGKVDVDHGETHCKTPDAVSYIRKSAERAK